MVSCIHLNVIGWLPWQAEMGNDCWQRFQMGALMGGSVGACIGILFGTMSVLKYGHGGNGFMRTVGKMVVQSAGSFGLFMGIGAFIRCDEHDSKNGIFHRSHAFQPSQTQFKFNNSL